jgi:hypothetical protein
MDKLELRARARAAARASGLFDDAHGDEGYDSPAAARGRSSTARARGVAPPPLDSIDEAQARAACRPMGELEYIVNAADAEGRTRAMYVIVPDLQLKSHYRRLGFEIEPGCRVLLDASALVPIAVMRVCARSGAATPPRCDASAGFNPYFDLPPA